jgi:hypothetical protein
MIISFSIFAQANLPQNRDKFYLNNEN